MVRLNSGMYTPTYGPTTTSQASTVAVSTTPSVSGSPTASTNTSGNAPTTNDKGVPTPRADVMYTVNAPRTPAADEDKLGKDHIKSLHDTYETCQNDIETIQKLMGEETKKLPQGVFVQLNSGGNIDPKKYENIDKQYGTRFGILAQLLKENFELIQEVKKQIDAYYMNGVPGSGNVPTSTDFVTTTPVPTPNLFTPTPLAATTPNITPS